MITNFIPLGGSDFEGTDTFRDKHQTSERYNQGALIVEVKHEGKSDELCVSLLAMRFPWRFAYMEIEERFFEPP